YRSASGEHERLRRLAEALGEDFTRQCLQIEHAASGLRLFGWVGLPTAARSSADQQFFYVNGRAVRDRTVAHAVRQAYADVLFHGRHPAFVLFLECDPRQADVNVHPAKHEGRFRAQRLVHEFIYRSLHEALASARAGTAGGDPMALPAAHPLSAGGGAAGTAGAGAGAGAGAYAAPMPPRQGGLGLADAPAAYAALYRAPATAAAAGTDAASAHDAAEV